MTSRISFRALFVSVVVVLAVAGPAAADPQNDKTQVDRQLAQVHSMYEAASAQVQVALQAYTAATAQLPAAQERLAVAKGVVAARRAESRQAQRDADAARAVADGADQRYADAAAQVDTARTQVSDFVSAAYKGSGLLTMDSLLESRTPNDLVDRLNYLDQSAHRQRQALDGFLASRLAARANRSSARSKRPAR